MKRHPLLVALTVFALLTLGCSSRSNLCHAPASPIAAVQGIGTESPRLGEKVVVRGVMSADFQGAASLGGFFLQTVQEDGDDSTAKGLFVAAAPGDALVGDRLAVAGTVAEHEGLTQLTDVEAITACGHARLPAARALTLPADSAGLERFEGMRVVLEHDMTITGVYALGQQGSLELAADGRLYEPRHQAAGSAALAPRRLRLDDGSQRQPTIPVPYLIDGRPPRVGDVVAELSGILSQEADTYVLHPTTPPHLARRNPPPPAPPGVEGAVRVAAFNVLNYFLTPGQRGASNGDELDRQRAKLVAALVALDADVIGLVELENDGGKALADLVDALNGDGSAGTYAAVDAPTAEDNAYGDDPIRVGMIYRPASLQPHGPPRLDGDPVFRRPPLAQTFRAGDHTFTVIVAHLKSKSCRDATGAEADQGDGQGCWNALRTRQAEQLLRFTAELGAASGDPDVLLVGDLNTHAGEDPVRTLLAGGLVDQAAMHIPAAERYSYVYRGQSGYLDHALTTASLAPQVRGAAFWHINADEAPLLDYNTEDRPAELYRPDPYRASDHDPILVGLNFP